MMCTPFAGDIMIDNDDIVAQELLLRDVDFPHHFVDMHHPDDYKVVSKPFVEYIPQGQLRRDRLIVRVCWKVADGQFLPMTCVCDTGAPKGLYLSHEAYRVLESSGRITVDEELGVPMAEIGGLGMALLQWMPRSHAPANLMGIKVLRKLGLKVDAGPENNFVLCHTPDAW